MDEHERQEARQAAEHSLESMTKIVTNWALLGEDALASQGWDVAQEIQAELEALGEGPPNGRLRPG